MIVPCRGEYNPLLRTRVAHVGKLLLAHRVDLQVVLA